MSSISEKVRAAVYVKTNVSAVVGANKYTAIYADKAPPGAVFPYGVFNRQGSEPIEYAFTLTQILESDLWQFRSYADSQSVAAALLTAWISTLGNTLTLVTSGNERVAWMARVNDLPPNDQQLNDRYIYGRGALVRIATE